MPWIAFVSMFLATAVVTSKAAALDPAAAGADRAFVRSVVSGDVKGAAAVLDQEFTWTTANGQTVDASHVTQALPKLAIANESAAQTMTYDYGNVGVVQVNSGKLHTLRVWVKRPMGWRLLVYQEVRSLDTAATTAAPPNSGKCENPCGAVPYSPKSAAEREVMKAYTSLEEAAMGGKAKEWSEVAADEIALVSANSDRTFDKATRAAAIAKASLGSVRPTKLLAARLFEFGNAVVMTSQHQADSGQHLQITRVWVKRDGRWQETLSYQTAAVK
jgi:hypothetical protein